MLLDHAAFQPLKSNNWHRPGAVNLLLSVGGPRARRVLFTRLAVLLPVLVSAGLLLAYFMGISG